MTYIYETVMGTKKLVVEYCYSSLDNCIKVVEMTEQWHPMILR
mgnify:CR=1 FL=1